MSIIYETLNRLEMEGLAQADKSDKARAPTLPSRSVRFPMSALATFMVMVFMGMGLVLWYWGDSLDRSDMLLISDKDSREVASETSDPGIAAAPVKDQMFAESRPMMSNWEEAQTEPQPATPVEQSSVEVAVEIVGEPTKEEKRPAAPEEYARSLDVGRVKPVIVADPVPTSGLEENGKSPDVVSVKPAVVADPIPTSGLEENGKSPDVVSVEPAVVTDPISTSDAAPVVTENLIAQAPVVSTNEHSGQQAAASGETKTSIVAAAAPAAKPAVPHKRQRNAQIVPSGGTAEPESVDDVVEQARTVLSRGQYHQALVALERLSPAPEDRVDFWLVKGSAHLALGQLESAERALGSAQLLAPTNAQIAVQRAILQQEKGDHAAALEILKDAAGRNPDVPEVFLNQGYSEQALGAVRDARHSFRIFLNITEGRSLYSDQRESVNRWLAQFSPASN